MIVNELELHKCKRHNVIVIVKTVSDFKRLF